MATTTSVSRHDRLQVGDLDAVLGGLPLGSGLGSAAITRQPASWISEAMPNPAAPSPIWPTTASSRRMPTWRQAAIAAAKRHDRGAVDVVVHDRLGQRLDQAALDLEAAGVEMSSRWMAPKPGAMRTTVSTNASTSLVSTRIGTALMPTSWA